MKIRKKGKWKDGEDKYVLEEDRKYIKTLPPANELYSMLCLENVSCPIKETKNGEPQKEPQTFAQSLLSEQQKQDTIEEDDDFKAEATPQDVENFKKIQDKIVGDLLK